GGVLADLGQRFTVVLSDNLAATSDAWVRIQVEMFALYSRRIAGHIGARRVSEFEPPVPAVGVPWRLDPPNTALSGAPRRHGATDAEGVQASGCEASAIMCSRLSSMGANGRCHSQSVPTPRRIVAAPDPNVDSWT